MIAAVNFLLDNTYVRFGNTVYRTALSHFRIFLHVYCYELEFMTHIQKALQERIYWTSLMTPLDIWIRFFLALNNPEFKKRNLS